ncbi:MAG TPA: hypothetical protein VMT89_07885, partial [Candidatus Acidoferrales bacterium]|nr:hypothetical protein [Candidatus Acidoferrales bacterium]
MMIAGCGDDGEGGVSSSTVEVTQSTVSVAGSIPSANPSATSDATTPDELNRAWAQAYQATTVPDSQIAKVLVLMPGFLGGAGDFDYLARRVVERTQGRTAVWAVDRRSNALEDQTGLDAAEAGHDADIAKGYYFHNTEVQNKTFAGFLKSTSNPFMSEWGIRTCVEDLDALISAARNRYTHAAIFLGGHSLGGSIVPIYAAWDFGAYAGFERLSGLVLLEGAPSPGASVPTQAQYETTGFGSGLTRSSLKTVRAKPITTLEPFVTTDLFVTAEILAMRVHHAFGNPGAISTDSDLYKGFVGLLFGTSNLPAVTNSAALGFGFDNDYQPLFFARVSIGSATGGPVGPNPNAPFLMQLLGNVGTLLAPTDPTATYGWQRTASDAPQPDPTDIDTFAGMLYRGPSNFIEWYFPTRLTLDAAVTSSLDVQRSGDWRKDVYGMAATENARVDLPVFAVGGSRGLLPDLSRLDPYRNSISPTLRNGSARNASSAGFQTILKDRYVHIDVLSASDEDGQG